MKRPLSSRGVVFFSGMPPGTTGTGQLVGWLCSQGCAVVFLAEALESVRGLARRGRFWAAIREALRPRLSRLVFAVRWWLEGRFGLHDVILLHPQTIGMGRVVDLVRRRHHPPVLFLLDCSYFCVRSYNHVEGESSPCLRCTSGRFDAIETFGCRALPVDDERAFQFVRELPELVARGRLGIVAQNATQARLASDCLGVDVPVVGLWTADWDRLLASAPPDGDKTVATADVVYHGYLMEAKGASWLLRVAAACPELSFLFPCDPPCDAGEVPRNCVFRPMSWDTGLEQAVADAAVVVVPSLWSAPVESALLKSLVVAKAVAVVDNPTAFASEVPDDVVLRLPTDTEAAAARLAAAVREGWRPAAASRELFLSRFRDSNSAMLNEVAGAVDWLAGGAPPPPTLHVERARAGGAIDD